MSDPTPTPAAAPAKGGGSGKMWAGVIVALIVVFSGLLDSFSYQLGHFLRTISNNSNVLMGSVAVGLLAMWAKGGKK